jgi:hypothetical protein
VPFFWPFSSFARLSSTSFSVLFGPFSPFASLSYAPFVAHLLAVFEFPRRLAHLIKTSQVWYHRA